ncbi:hypothetical protein ACFO0M_04305 [Micromonospora mangrovi]|uniref:Uncharacterized protein n=2 Tax=Micromonospora TaxID=1873 RepID=A0AAU7M196_9ACTN
MIMRFDYGPDRGRLVAATRRAGRRTLLRTRSLGALFAPDQLLFRLNKAQFLPVVTADLPPEQREELISYLRRRGLVFRGEAAKWGTPATPPNR